MPLTAWAAVLSLSKLSALFFVLGLIAAVRAFIDAMLGFVAATVGRLPIIGPFFSSGIGKLAQIISNKMGSWIMGLDATYGAFFIALSTITSELAQGQLDSAVFDFINAKKFAGVNDPATINKRVTKAINKASAAVATANSGIVTNTRENHLTAAKAKAVAKAQTAGLAGELDHVIEWDLPRLRARTRAVEDSLGRAWNWIRARPKTIAETVAAGAVAIALAQLGASWIRCRNWKRVGRDVCASPLSDIEGFLAIALGAAAIADFRELVKLAQSVEHVTAEGIKDLLQV